MIGEKVLSHPACREAQIILAYAGYRSEVDTLPLIRQALTAGKIVFAPKVAGEEMEFWQISSVGDLHDGYRGIPEPEERMALPEWLQRQGETVCKAMMWMPGAVFDRERHRIGYGKGFYDRYLARLRSTAVCQADRLASDYGGACLRLSDRNAYSQRGARCKTGSGDHGSRAVRRYMTGVIRERYI